MLRCNTTPIQRRRTHKGDLMASQVLDTVTDTVWAQFVHAVTERRQRFAAWRAKRAYRARIARELNSYTDRELVDLGIQRADIPAVLNGTFRR
jgi:uncharacterized protein YjiS (DUF1127 family)